MFTQSLYKQTGQVLEKLLKTNPEIFERFYLAGGTSLALQLGHRKSIDLDFFTNSEFSTIEILQALSTYRPEVTQQTAGTLDLVIDSVKVSFLQYKYPLLREHSTFSINENLRSINLASPLDIACMKISAISSRGSRKDFIDLYFLLQIFNLTDILLAFDQKFSDVKYSKNHIFRSLNYFADAEKDPDVDYLKPTSWDKVKSTIRNEANKAIQIILES